MQVPLKALLQVLLKSSQNVVVFVVVVDVDGCAVDVVVAAVDVVVLVILGQMIQFSIPWTISQPNELLLNFCLSYYF